MGHPDSWWWSWWGGLIASVFVELYAVVEVADGVVFHGGVGVDWLGAMAVELEPGHAAVDVFEVAVPGVGVEGEELVEVLKGGVVVGGGGDGKVGAFRKFSKPPKTSG